MAPPSRPGCGPLHELLCGGKKQKSTEKLSSRLCGTVSHTAAIQATEDYLQALSRLPLTSADGGGAEVEDLRVSSSKMVVDFISGDRGRVAVREMFCMLSSFRCDAWEDLNISYDEKFEYASNMMMGLGDMWRRLVFNVQVPKLEMLCVVSKAETPRQVQPMLEGLKRRSEQCQDCVCMFTKTWMSRLMTDDSACEALTSCRDLVATLPVITSKCERKHLLGQDCKPGRRRGRALHPRKLSQRSYAKSVQQVQRRRKTFVQAACVGKCGWNLAQS